MNKPKLSFIDHPGAGAPFKNPAQAQAFLDLVVNPLQDGLREDMANGVLWPPTGILTVLARDTLDVWQPDFEREDDPLGQLERDVRAFYHERELAVGDLRGCAAPYAEELAAWPWIAFTGYDWDGLAAPTPGRVERVRTVLGVLTLREVRHIAHDQEAFAPGWLMLTPEEGEQHRTTFTKPHLTGLDPWLLHDVPGGPTAQARASRLEEITNELRDKVWARSQTARALHDQARDCRRVLSGVLADLRRRLTFEYNLVPRQP